MTTSDSKLAEDVNTPESAAIASDTSPIRNDSPVTDPVTSDPAVSQSSEYQSSEYQNDEYQNVNSANTQSSAGESAHKATHSKMNNNHTATAQPSRQSGSGLTWLLILINLAFIGAAGYGGYWGWNQWLAFQTAQQAQIQLSQNQTQQLITGELTEQITSAQQQIQQQATSLTRNVEQQVASQNTRLQDMQQQIQRLSGTQATSWQTAEAMFLIRMAGRKIWLENNPQTAILLLQQADYQLANISDSRLYLVRQKIAQDIGQLQALKQALPDQQVLRLQSLYQIVDTLPFAQTALIASRQNRNAASNGTFWEKTGQWFKANVVEINRVEQAFQPLLTEEHTWLVREQIKYQLLIAQQGLLQEQSGIFRNSLTQIETLLSQYLDSTHPNVSGFLAQLTLVSQHKFTTTTPDALSSEAALAQFLQQESLPTPVNSSLSSVVTDPERQNDSQGGRAL